MLVAIFYVLLATQWNTMHRRKKEDCTITDGRTLTWRFSKLK